MQNTTIRIFRIATFILLIANSCQAILAADFPDRPEIPAEYKEELDSLTAELADLWPQEFPLLTEANARNMLRTLETWRSKIDDSAPPGWREKIKSFSIECGKYDKKLRWLHSKSQISQEELAEWTRYYHDEACPLWVNSMANMQAYHQLMRQYRHAVEFWSKVIKELET